MRRAIAASMSRSGREISHYYLAHRVPLQAAAAWMERENAGRPVTERILMAALQLKAVALAAQHFPEMNGSGTMASSGCRHPSRSVLRSHCGRAASSP